MKLPMAKVAALLLAISTGVWGQKESVSQDQSVSSKEGEPTQLNCSYQGTASSMHWYKQSPDGQMEFLGILHRTTSESRGRYVVSLDTKNKTTSFYLNSTRSSDSAVYFCAMGPMNYGNDKVTFGSGTRLLVLPNLEDSEPSLYGLKPQKGGNENISACLITDYSPGSISAWLNDASESNSSSLVITNDGPSYGTVLWDDNTGNFSCEASHEGTIYSLNHMEDGDGTCQAEFETDERLNFLSLTVLGLRVIFLKSVAVNLLLTFRLWSC